MLDVSRHFFTKQEVKRFIDLMAEYKYNVFHWHLSDDQGWRVEIKSLPRLTDVGAWRAPRVGNWWEREPQSVTDSLTYGGFYTQDDIREVVEYARERFITVVPEIDVPGHSMALLTAYPEISCTGGPFHVNVGNTFYTKEENSLCVGKEKTFAILDMIFDELVDLFPSSYIHIGGDECYKGFYCGLCHSLRDTYGLRGQVTLTYDMTFLVLLLSSVYDLAVKEEHKRCIIHPAGKRRVIRTEAADYAADINMLLSYYHFVDDKQDEHSLAASL